MTPRNRKQPAAAAPLELCYTFGFDAAHHFETMPRKHRYRSLHGHSFRAEVAIRGVPRPPNGFIADFAMIEKACAALHEQLDHRLLNDVPGLETPSLENISVWIWQRLSRRFPGIARVTVRRDSLGQSCSYFGP